MFTIFRNEVMCNNADKILKHSLAYDEDGMSLNFTWTPERCERNVAGIFAGTFQTLIQSTLSAFTRRF